MRCLTKVPMALRGCTTEPSGARDKRSRLLWSYEWPGISSQQSCSRTAQLRARLGAGCDRCRIHHRPRSSTRPEREIGGPQESYLCPARTDTWCPLSFDLAISEAGDLRFGQED
jgi:hypothetical protein